VDELPVFSAKMVSIELLGRGSDTIRGFFLCLVRKVLAWFGSPNLGRTEDWRIFVQFTGQTSMPIGTTPIVFGVSRSWERSFFGHRSDTVRRSLACPHPLSA